MKKVIVLLMILSISSIFTSCESATYCDISPYVAKPTFNANIGPIVRSTCASCHSGGKQYPDLENYVQVKLASEFGSLICRIDQSKSCGAIMPQSGPMPECTIDMFNRWATPITTEPPTEAYLEN